MISNDTLREIAQSCREFYVTDKIEWPDCATVSQDIIDELYKNYSDEFSSVVGVEYQINHEYHHYAVQIEEMLTNSSVIVDASFSQFANEADTPISVAPISELDPVSVVSPAGSYIFHNHKTNEFDELNRI